MKFLLIALVLALAVSATQALAQLAGPNSPCNNVTLTTGETVCIQPGATVFGSCDTEAAWTGDANASLGDLWCQYPLTATAGPAGMPVGFTGQPMWHYPLASCGSFHAVTWIICQSPTPAANNAN